MKGEKIRNRQESFIWECERCGRKSLFSFELHATSKLTNDCCKGKARKVRWKNAW